MNGRYKTGYNVEIDKLSLDQNLLTWIDTGRPITGTNVLGFKPKITDDMKLQIYWEPIRQTIDIKFQQQLPGDYNIYRFVFPTVPMYIGKDTLDNQLIRIVIYIPNLVARLLHRHRILNRPDHQPAPPNRTLHQFQIPPVFPARHNLPSLPITNRIRPSQPRPI